MLKPAACPILLPAIQISTPFLGQPFSPPLSTAASKHRRTPIMASFSFFIEPICPSSLFLLFHILLGCFLGSLGPDAEEPSVCPGHAQSGEGLEVLLFFRDNPGLLLFVDLRKGRVATVTHSRSSTFLLLTGCHRGLNRHAGPRSISTTAHIACKKSLVAGLPRFSYIQH